MYLFYKIWLLINNNKKKRLNYFRTFKKIKTMCLF